MPMIELSNGMLTEVSEQDYTHLSQFKWHFSTYPIRWLRKSKRKYKPVAMHREIMGPGPEAIDHVDRNPLNNTRSNLRPCTHQQNMFNKRKAKNKSSVFKGVGWKKHCSRWRAILVLNNKQIHLGYFESEREAAAAYNKAAQSHYGEFAVLNQL